MFPSEWNWRKKTKKSDIKVLKVSKGVDGIVIRRWNNKIPPEKIENYCKRQGDL